VLALLLLPLIAGSLVYCVLTVVAARRYLTVRPGAIREFPPISVLKPLAGADLDLEDNLRSFFEQDYPAFEMLFAARTVGDPAAEVARRLQASYPNVPSRLLITGEPPYPNAKVFSLDRMLGEARHELVVMSDSDIRVNAGALRTLAAEFQDQRLGLASCPYKVVPGRSFWSLLDALGLNTEFLGGVLVARMVDGMKFAIGPTVAARKQVLERIGGFSVLKDYLAEDFVMGKRTAAAGYGVILSSCVIEHHIGAQNLRANVLHRLRWSRSTRRSRPWGYVGLVFTNPLPLAFLFTAVLPRWWPVLAVTAALRAAAAWAIAGWVLHDGLTRRRWWLLPLADAASFLGWLAGFFGRTILWRGRKYRLLRDGRFELLQRG